MPSPAQRASGFTLVELLVVFALVATAMALGIPAIQNFIVRSKTEGFAREASVLMQRTRFEAIKRNRDGAVYMDTADPAFAAFLDADGDGVFTPGTGPNDDYEIGRLPLPSGVQFKAPGPIFDAASVDSLSLVDAKGVTGLPAVIFEPDGSVVAVGAFRVADERENYLEVRIEPEATGRIEILKLSDEDSLYHAAGDVADPNHKPWEWN